MPESRTGVTDAIPERKVEVFSVDVGWLRKSQGLRLDASHYNPTLAHALSILRHCGMHLQRLEEVTARIFIPPRFKRIYVEKEHGIPFVQGSHIVHFQPADLKYLSKKAHKNLGKYIIERGWVLVTCSGTIGRVMITPDGWHLWAASQHILRIVPDGGGPCPAGYIYAFLTSFCGQAQLTSQIYGAVVDELTEEQARGILIPVPKTKAQRASVEHINELALGSVTRKQEAVLLAERSLEEIGSLIGHDVYNPQVAEGEPPFHVRPKGREKKRRGADRLSLYPPKPGDALRVFMQVDPGRVKDPRAAEKQERRGARQRKGRKG